MSVKQLTDTTLTWICPTDGTSVAVLVSALVAGTGNNSIELDTSTIGSPNMIDVGACPTDGTQGRYCRTFRNPRFQAGLINSLHAQLVTLVQVNPLWTTFFLTDTPPTYEPTFPTVDPETRIDIPQTTDGNFDGYDLAVTESLLTTSEAQNRVRANVIMPGGSSDAEITAFVNSLFAQPADQALYFNRLQARRILLYGA